MTEVSNTRLREEIATRIMASMMGDLRGNLPDDPEEVLTDTGEVHENEAKFIRVLAKVSVSAANALISELAKAAEDD